jgi:hypothetical protein
MSSNFGHAVRASPTDGITPPPLWGSSRGGVATLPLVMGMFDWTVGCCIGPQRQK